MYLIGLWYVCALVFVSLEVHHVAHGYWPSMIPRCAAVHSYMPIWFLYNYRK